MSTFRLSLVLLTVLPRLNNACEEQDSIYFIKCFIPVKARTCARDPVQQHFFCIPYGVSTEAHVLHTYSTGTD